MTTQEAKALFEEDLKEGKCSDTCPECNARELAILALEKQIPKKPISYEKHYFICPCCKEELGIDEDDIAVYNMTPPKHCENCGQALDWSDTE